MFTAVKQWLNSKDHFVCILIDEVESLTHARKANGLEPSDSIRVVNAVLTQIDQLQRYPNVLILATSNVTNTIDIAFSDRADLKLLLAHPSMWAIYKILSSCIDELIDCKLINGSKSDFFTVDIYSKISMSVEENEYDGNAMTKVLNNSNFLKDVAQICTGLSGRVVRKIPFLASAKFANHPIPDLKTFLKAMMDVSKEYITNDSRYFYTENSINSH